MKHILLLLLILLASCSPERSAEAEEIARAVFDAFNAHDWKKMESLYSPDVELVDPSFGNKTGKQGLTDFYRSVPDIHDEIKSVTASGNVAVVEFVSTGTIEGQKFTLPICTVLRVENGQVVSDHTYYDKN
jgi:ketosteroid isomerase-like protein